MAGVIAVANQKGGVGKTTSAVNLAAFCGLAGRRVLVIDSDPQGNASSVLAPSAEGPSIYGGGEPIETACEGVSIVPYSVDLIEHEQRLSEQDGGRLELRNRLRDLRASFDTVFIDCPPSLATLPLNALLAADLLLIPIQCEYYAMEGLGQILSALEALAHLGYQELPRPLVLLTMFDSGVPLAGQVVTEVRGHLGEQVLKHLIPRDPALAAAPSHSQTILDYAPVSDGGLAYLGATKEVLDDLE